MSGRRKVVISVRPVRPAPLRVAVPIFQVLSLYRAILIDHVGVRLGALLIPVFAPSDIAHAISLIQAAYAQAVTCMSFWRARRRMLVRGIRCCRQVRSLLSNSILLLCILSIFVLVLFLSQNTTRRMPGPALCSTPPSPIHRSRPCRPSFI
jgi:hypothetical protein